MKSLIFILTILAGGSFSAYLGHLFITDQTTIGSIILFHLACLFMGFGFGFVGLKISEYFE